MEQIREFFEVRTLQPDIKSVPADIDVLMLVQPDGLTADAAYAIDQFALGGGRILAFVDPVAETSPAQGGMMGMPMPEPGPMPSLLKLLKAWGVGLDPAKVAGDPALARRVQFGGGRRPVVTDYLGWLQIDKNQINEKDVLAASIERLHLASTGILTKAEGATTDVTPIIETTAKGGELDTEKLRFQPDPIGPAARLQIWRQAADAGGPHRRRGQERISRRQARSLPRPNPRTPRTSRPRRPKAEAKDAKDAKPAEPDKSFIAGGKSTSSSLPTATC